MSVTIYWLFLMTKIIDIWNVDYGMILKPVYDG